MKWRDWLAEWGMTSLSIKTYFLNMEWEPQDQDRSAAWELYIELLTRITTQKLSDEDGDEQSALDSVYALFPLTREIIKRYGPQCMEFTKIAIVVLNQVIRPFTAKWHKESLSQGFSNPQTCSEFRRELADLQILLRKYMGMLANMADVEDLGNLEITD